MIKLTPSVLYVEHGKGVLSPSLSYCQLAVENGQSGGADRYCFKPKPVSFMSVSTVGLVELYPLHVVLLSPETFCHSRVLSLGSG
jgi:hypothetical protein